MNYAISACHLDKIVGLSMESDHRNNVYTNGKLQDTVYNVFLQQLVGMHSDKTYRNSMDYTHGVSTLPGVSTSVCGNAFRQTLLEQHG